MIGQRGQTKYAFKWFLEDEKGQLHGSYQSQFKYKKTWQATEVAEPRLCVRGYHVVGIDDVLNNAPSTWVFSRGGGLTPSLWLVAVRGVGRRIQESPTTKSAWRNVRPIKRLCTLKELTSAYEAAVVKYGSVGVVGAAEMPGLSWEDRHNVNNLVRQATNAVSALRKRNAMVDALVSLWNLRFPSYGRGSYYAAKLAIRQARHR